MGQRCGGEYFSCIDCGKSFGEDYDKHTSCVQEDDKYHGQWAKKKKGNNAKLKGTASQANGHAAPGKVCTKVPVKVPVKVTADVKPNGVSNGTSNGTSNGKKIENAKKRKRDCDDEKLPPAK